MRRDRALTVSWARRKLCRNAGSGFSKCRREHTDYLCQEGCATIALFPPITNERRYAVHL